jgi:cell pole-organizing protein PopZ
MKLHRLAAAACAAALVAAPAVAADLTIVYKTTGAGGPGTATSYFSPEKMRVSDAERDTIVEYGPGRIVSIDHKKKEYSEVTLAELEAAMKAAADRMQQMNAQMASMPPAVREKMQGMMGGGSVAVTKGATRKVAGYDCTDYDVVMGGMVEMHLCATTAIAPPVPAVGGDFSRFKGFAGSATALAMNPMFKGVIDEMKKVQGFTIAESSAVKMMGRSTATSKEATEVKTSPIPAEAFDVAALTKGYKKVENPAAKMK